MKTGIIKTVKTNRYTQIHNDVVQKKLKKLNSIGVLTYLLSLPEEWTIRKTDLQKRFGKAAVNQAFEELEEMGFLASFQFRNGNRNDYAYAVSDIEFDMSAILDMAKEAGLPLMSVKCKFPEINEMLKVNETLQHVDTPNNFQEPNLSSSTSAAQFEQLNLSNSKTALTKETMFKEFSSKEFSSSSSEVKVIDEVKIDKELKEQFPAVPFEEVKALMLADETLVINTERQYKALLKYRLSNYKPKKAVKPFRKNKQQQGGYKEVVPDWFERRNEAKPIPKEEEEIDFEAEHAKILAKLGIDAV